MHQQKLSIAKLISLIIIALGTSTLLSSCGNNTNPYQAANKQQILLKGNAAEPEDLDPHTVIGLAEFNIIRALYEGLINLDPKDLHLIPGVAKSWDVSTDGLLYTFHIRDNARWSNGDALTAHDFVFSFKRILTRSLAAPYAYFLYGVKGAEAYHNGESTDFSQVAITAPNALTLQIELSKPIPYFLSLLAHDALNPVHPLTILKHNASSQRGTPWTRPKNIVSNGPFSLKSWEMGNFIEVQRNPLYWDNDSVQLNGIRFFPMDAQTEERAFRAHQLHITDSLPPNKVRHYIKTQSPFLHINPSFMTYAYVFNTAKPPFDDVRVRQAFSLALDRASIVQNVTQRGEFPAYAYTPPGSGNYKTSAQLHENLSEAQQHLADAGYPNGKNFPKVTLLYNISDTNQAIAEAIQFMWKTNLNVHVELINQEWKVYLRNRKGNDFNILRSIWIGDYLDPTAFLDVPTSISGNNYSKWHSPSYDALIQKAANTLNPEQRFQTLDQAENLLMEQLPIMPIYFYNIANLVQPNVKNWHSNVLDIHPYKYVYLED